MTRDEIIIFIIGEFFMIAGGAIWFWFLYKFNQLGNFDDEKGGIKSKRNKKS